MLDSINSTSIPQDEKSDLLHEVVLNFIREEGQLHEGKIWAIKTRKEWAISAGLSIRTISRKFQKPPYDTLRKVVERKQAILVRIGTPDPNQPSRLAAAMAKKFTEKTGQKVSPRGYGCLIGLVCDFRASHQLDIFEYAISTDGWKGAKSLSKYKTEDLETPIGKSGWQTKLKPDKAHLFRKHTGNPLFSGLI